MIKAGVPVPACWEHREDAVPGSKKSRDDAKSMRAKGTAGFVSQFEIDEKSQLWAQVPIEDPAEAAAVQRVKFCSPYIAPSVLDGDGTDWGVAIAHLALTPKPRNHRQPPAVALSMLDEFSRPLMFAIDFEKGDDMADDPKKTDDKSAEDGSPAELGQKSGDGSGDTGGGGQTDPPPKPPSEKDVAFKAALATLADAGYVLGADTTEANLLERLVVAINTKKAAESGSMQSEDDLPPGGGGAFEEMPPGSVTGTPVLMSRLEEYERASLARRLDNLLRSGRCKPAEHKQQKEKLLARDAAKGIKLSFGDDGKPVPNDLSGWIADREKLTRGSVFSMKNSDNPKAAALSRADEPQPPANLDKDAEAKEMRELAKKEADRVSVKRK
jgi:hypothetical protein